MIRFEEVTVSVGTVTLLDRLTLAIAPGAPTVLIGPNGAGKTTVLRAAMGLLQPTSGRIVWDGEPRRAIVFQRPTMLRRSAAANVRYASVGADRTRELLELVGLRMPPIVRRGGCRPASSSGWRWPAPWRAIRKSCSSTSRPRASIPPRPRRSRT